MKAPTRQFYKYIFLGDIWSPGKSYLFLKNFEKAPLENLICSVSHPTKWPIYWSSAVKGLNNTTSLNTTSVIGLIITTLIYILNPLFCYMYQGVISQRFSNFCSGAIYRLPQEILTRKGHFESRGKALEKKVYEIFSIFDFFFTFFLTFLSFLIFFLIFSTKCTWFF